MNLSDDTAGAEEAEVVDEPVFASAIALAAGEGLAVAAAVAAFAVSPACCAVRGPMNLSDDTGGAGEVEAADEPVFASAIALAAGEALAVAAFASLACGAARLAAVDCSAADVALAAEELELEFAFAWSWAPGPAGRTSVVLIFFARRSTEDFRLWSFAASGAFASAVAFVASP